jgi:elongation factor 3
MLDGIRSRVKTVMKMVNVSFKYETASTAILTDATVRLTLGSRVALVGLNGAGACCSAVRLVSAAMLTPRSRLHR